MAMSFYDKNDGNFLMGEDDFCDLDRPSSRIAVDVEDLSDGFQILPLDETEFPYYGHIGAGDDDEEIYDPPKPSTPEECIEFLKAFFGNKQMHYGGPVPMALLLTDRHIDMVLRLDLDKCIKFFHKSLREQQCRRWKVLRNRTELFFKLQKESHDLNIPKHHSGGLLLVYLILCLGYSL